MFLWAVGFQSIDSFRKKKKEMNQMRTRVTFLLHRQLKCQHHSKPPHSNALGEIFALPPANTTSSSLSTYFLKSFLELRTITGA
mmetsp:Transcript_33717/g.70885  ORF Transcript_33717/g.70885 Transcript_33717/m.70885 type:complete len:84 (-) Transcript_33717:1431-1682(-)